MGMLGCTTVMKTLQYACKIHKFKIKRRRRKKLMFVVVVVYRYPLDWLHCICLQMYFLMFQKCSFPVCWTAYNQPAQGAWYEKFMLGIENNEKFILGVKNSTQSTRSKSMVWKVYVGCWKQCLINLLKEHSMKSLCWVLKTVFDQPVQRAWYEKFMLGVKKSIQSTCSKNIVWQVHVGC